MNEPATRPEAAKARAPTATSWKAGQSGNPAGRAKKLPEVREKIAQSLGAAVVLLADIVRGKHGADIKDRLAAAKILLDWGLAKPPPDANAAAAPHASFPAAACSPPA